MLPVGSPPENLPQDAQATREHDVQTMTWFEGVMRRPQVGQSAAPDASCWSVRWALPSAERSGGGWRPRVSSSSSWAPISASSSSAMSFEARPRALAGGEVVEVRGKGIARSAAFATAAADAADEEGGAGAAGWRP